MASDNDSNIAVAKSAVDRVFEQSQRIPFIEFFAIHDLCSSSLPRLVFVIRDQAGPVLLDQFLMNLCGNRGIA